MVIHDFYDLNSSQVVSLAKALKHAAYSFGTSDLLEENAPVGLNDFYRSKSSYEFLLDDSDAFAKFVHLRFNDAGSPTFLPVGVFGVSPANKLRFPLILNRFSLSFLRMNKEEFVELIAHTEDADNSFCLLLEIRAKFIRSIFSFYATLGNGYDSVMGWDIKGRNSNTRQIAESINFIRHELIDTNSEFYSLNKLCDSTVNYLVNSSIRSEYGRKTNEEIDAQSASKKNPPATQTVQSLEMMVKGFYRQLVS